MLDVYPINADDFSPSHLMEPLLGERQPLNAVDGGAGPSYVAEEQNVGDIREPSNNGESSGSHLVQLYPAGKILQIYEQNNNR